MSFQPAPGSKLANCVPWTSHNRHWTWTCFVDSHVQTCEYCHRWLTEARPTRQDSYIHSTDRSSANLHMISMGKCALQHSKPHRPDVNCSQHTTTTVLRPFGRDYPGEPVPEETLTHPPSRSSSNLYQLLPSTMIHSILLVQNPCLAIFLHNLFPCPLWSTSWSGALHLIFHTFLHPISVLFSQHIPIPLQPVLHIKIISSIPSRYKLLNLNLS